METKICTRCLSPKAEEMFGKSKGGKNGLKSRCKRCESDVAAQKYAARVGRPIKAKPILMSWQPRPGEKFDACLGRTWCMLNPFVCEENDTTAVIATTPEGRWKLDKAEFVFLRAD